ncbi:hypothetical protein V494_07215 [Pseudogymnoascus sp. VKM F-4513 (FW-928)]|nr:hypothetical protein V494_07215 [Pseudogymnoascus sp. VKM F-4513 (FW-928)]
MAGYPPPPSFGPAPGQRGQAVPFQYPTPQNPEYAYARPSQSTNMSAFEQNAANLAPGFEYNAMPPPFNPPARNSGAPPLPVYGGFDPSALYQIPLWAAQGNPPGVSNPLQPSTMGVVSGQGPFALQSESMQQNTAEASATRARTQAAEEGELSEGEYEEDNVEGIAGSPRGGAVDYNDYRKSRPGPSNGALNQRQSSFERMAPDPLTDSYGRSRDMHRQSSDSYSPPSSGPDVSVLPSDKQQNSVYPFPKAIAYSDRQLVPFQAIIVNPAHLREQDKEAFGVSNQGGESISSRQEENRKREPENRSSLTSTSVSRAKSVQDARRQAQNAVLNLIPLKVRFQNFIDEGIDEEIIKSVFDDIGMSSSYSSTKKLSGGTGRGQHPASFTPQAVASVVPDSVASRASQIHSKLNTNTTNTNGTSQHTGSPQQTINSAVPMTNKAEERKDRIARLLEEKSKKLMNLPQPLPPATATLADGAPTNKSTTPQSTTKVDKEKLLKQKMEALQKSREARAQKATAKQTTSTAMQSGTVESGQPHIPQSQITHPSTSVPLTLPTHDIRTYSASPQHSGPQASLPSIPGLFLSGTPGTLQTSIPQSTSIVPSSNLRKRPVASDFDSNAPTNTTYKRPFGHNRNDQRLVIDVSEEESDNESVEMEIDDQVGDTSARDVQTSNPSRPDFRDLPPLSDFPPKKSFPAPSSTLSTPPSLQGPQRSSTRPEDLKRKEFEIQEMRRKIAEAEQRKKAKLVASGSQTPMNKTSTPIESRSAKDASISDKIHTSVHIERLIDDASRRIEEEQEKLARAQALEEHSAEDLKQRETEQRRQRRARIAADLPVVDAEVQESQRRLAGLREEMENLELAVQKRLEEKRRLAEEMEKLGHEVDDQLEAQKDALISLTGDIAMGQEGTSVLSVFYDAAYVDIISPFSTLKDLSAHSIGDSQVLPEPADAESSPVDPNPETVAGQEDISMSDYRPSSESPTSQGRATTEGLASKELSLSPAEVESPGSQPQLRDSPGEESASPNLVDDQPSEAIVAGLPIKPSADQDAATEADTNMTEPQPQDSQLSPQARDQLQTPPTDLNVDDTNPPSQQETEDEVDMEESIADDAESMQSKDMEIDELYPSDNDSIIDVQAQNASASESVGVEHNLDSTADGDSDVYEPPEATPPSSTELITADSPPFSPQSPESTQDAPGTDQDMILASFEDSAEPAKQDQPERAPAQKSFFTPYESPLKRFKAYRFHPEFTKQVPGGYKSLTYSNNIDDSKELCRFELAGGVCNDVSCEFQHFRDIVLPDELILVSLGDSSGYKEEDRTRFIKGLKEVLQDLRISKIRDFQVIAAKICVIAHELSNSLVTLRLANVYDLSSKIFLLRFAKPDDKKQMIIDSGFRCHLTSFSRATAASPSVFVTKLRKFLKTRRVTAVSQIGTDRIIEFQFSEGQYRLYLEFYAGGNIILTDKELNILTLLRTVPPGEGQEEQRIGLKYSLENRQNYLGIPPLTKDRLQEALQKAVEQSENAPAQKKQGKKGIDSLRRALAVSITEFPPLLVDHAMRVTDFDHTLKPADIANNDGLLEDLLRTLEEADRVVKQITGTEVATGYIIAKKQERTDKIASGDEQTEQQALLYEDFHPFKPRQFENDPGCTFVPFEGFNNTVDEFFSSIEGQRLESRLHEREATAKKKLQAAKDDQQKRLGGLQEIQTLNERKAGAIEANVQRVQEATDAVNGLIAQGMDWIEIGKLIDIEQKRGNPVASIIKLPLKLHENTITLLLDEEIFVEDSDDEAYETGSDVSDSEDEAPAKEPAKKVADKRLTIDINLGASPWSNAREYYGQRRSAAEKEKKTLESSTKALKSTSHKIQQDLKKGLKQEKAILRPVRKHMWFEKFTWFISSDGYLVLGGRDAQQNEILYKRYLRKGDVYVHADLDGATSVFIRNHEARIDAPIPPSTLSQAGILAVSSSSAWESKAGMPAWWANADQVSKSAPTGDYLKPGSFEVRGKKNFLPPAPLLLGFGVMFHISDESMANHVKHRVPGSEGALAASTKPTESAGHTTQPISDDEDNQRNASDDDDDEQSDEINGTSSAESRQNPLQFTGSQPNADVSKSETDVETTTLSGLQDLSVDDDKAPTTSNAGGKDGKGPSPPTEVDDAKSEADAESSSEEGVATPSSTSTKQKGQAPLPRGKRNKLKKASQKYKHQDLEDKLAAQALTGATAGVKKAEAEAEAKRALEAEREFNERRRKAQHERTQQEIAKHEEARKAMMESGQDIVDEEVDEAEKAVSLDSLVGTPLPGDEILDVIPMCAPWTAMGKYKYKVKLQPGPMKKGRAVKEILSKWGIDSLVKAYVDENSNDVEKMWPREVELVKGLKAEEIVNVIPVGKVAIMLGGGASGAARKGGGAGKGKGGRGSKKQK